MFLADRCQLHVEILDERLPSLEPEAVGLLDVNRQQGKEVGIMNTGDLNSILHSVESFPSLSASAPKLMTLLFDSETNADQIEDALRYDPGLTVNILKLTNSAYFGFSGKIGSVRQAIVILGRQNLIKLVITSCVKAIIDKEVLGYELTPGQL